MGNLLNHYITLVMKCLIPNLPHCLEWAMVIRVTLAGRPGRRSAFSMTLVWANNLHGLFQFSNLSLIIQLFRLTWKYLFSYNVSVKNFIKQCSLFVSFTEINTGSQRISLKSSPSQQMSHQPLSESCSVRFVIEAFLKISFSR